jgi:saccharopine dehydrogenase (NAD+, L-lysine-forming)
MGEGTGIPAALGAILMQQGKIKEKGVFPPEAGVDPMDMLQLAKQKVKVDKKGGLPIVIEHIDKNGNLKRINL